MLYEFAITPDVFTSPAFEDNSANKVIVVQLLRGICDNGMIANLHRGRWINHIQNVCLASLSPDLRDKIIACLNVLDNRHRLVRHPRCNTGEPATERDWFQLMLDSDTRIPFYEVVMTDPFGVAENLTENRFLGLSNVLDSDLWNTRRRTLDVERTSAEYNRILSPILRHAKTLDLVDPYMNSQDQKFTRVIDICSRLMGQRAHDRLEGRIHIHTHKENQKPDGRDENSYLSNWEAILRPLSQRDRHRFKIFFWRNNAGGPPFHDRYLITDQCGLSVPSGLDLPNRRNPGTTAFSLLDEEDRLKILENFNEVTSPYETRATWQREIV